MINPKKVELMTGMAMYEHTKKTSFRQERYFKKNYRLFIALKSIPVGIIIAVLILFIITAAAYKKLVTVYEVLGAAACAAIGVFAVLLICAAYVFLSAVVIGSMYENMRGSYVRYRLFEKQLAKMKSEE